jgi:hypothetical protein
MRERAAASRWKLWVLLRADRRLVTAAVLGLVFLSLVGAAALAPVSLPTVLEGSDPTETLFQALVTAIVTGVTLVVTITQLVLSQELGALGDQRERMAGAMEFRADVAELLEAPTSPAEPAAFLRALVASTGACARDLADAVEGTTDPALRERLDTYAEGLAADADAVADRLEGAHFGTFEVLFAALDYDYSWKLSEARRLQAAESLPAAATTALDEVVERLRLFGPAREHVKTLYFQWALTDLSRSILYAAVPALVVAIAGLLFLDAPGAVPGTTLGLANVTWVVAGATTVALAPFALLLSYVLRIATVAKRTLAIGPFVLRETDRSGGVDREDGG